MSERVIRVSATENDGTLLDWGEVVLTDDTVNRLAVVPMQRGNDDPRSLYDLEIGSADGTSSPTKGENNETNRFLLTES